MRRRVSVGLGRRLRLRPTSPTPQRSRIARRRSRATTRLQLASDARCRRVRPPCRSRPRSHQWRLRQHLPRRRWRLFLSHNRRRRGPAACRRGQGRRRCAARDSGRLLIARCSHPAALVNVASKRTSGYSSASPPSPLRQQTSSSSLRVSSALVHEFGVGARIDAKPIYPHAVVHYPATSEGGDSMSRGNRSTSIGSGRRWCINSG